jgi:hypothetical protein
MVLRPPVLPAAAVLALELAAQVPTGTAVVLTHPAGPAAAQVLAVSAAGAVSAFGRFPSDTMPPLAIELDPFDRHVIVALDRGNGMTRIVRLVPDAAGTFVLEIQIGDLTGRCEQLAVAGDQLLALVPGPAGAIWSLPRRGGLPVAVFAQANAAAMHASLPGTFVTLGWSGVGGSAAPAPGIVQIDAAGGLVVQGPFPFANLPGRALTGVVDLPATPARLVAFGDGSFALHTVGSGNPAPVPMTPQPPPGGAAAMKSDGQATSALAVGGASFPFLYRADAVAAAVTIVAGPLPGGPVDVAPALPAAAQVLEFEAPCGVPALLLANGLGGLPWLGNPQFDLRVGNCTANQGVVFVAGTSDVIAGSQLLPFTLPGGCPLHVSPDAVAFRIANGIGYARVALPVPNVPGFAGLLLSAQWLQILPGGFATSPVAVVQIGF